MTSHALYSWHHTHYIWHVIYCVWYHIHYMCDIAQWLYLWHHNLYVYDKSSLYGITHSVMTTQPLCNLTATMSDITPIVPVSSHPMYPFYQTQCMNDITTTICITSYALHRTSHPLCMTTHPFLYDIKSSISDITSTISDLMSTVSVSSHPLYRWYHSHYIYDITYTICVTSYPLCRTSQHCVWMTPHSEYMWQHLHCRWHHIHSITQNHSIYDVTSTSGMTSHPLYQTSPPLYRHHNFSTDITPNCVWHNALLMCDIICTTYNITSTPYVITLLYLWHHNLYISNHIQYVGQHRHYTCDITATNLCHHTHCIDIITPTLCMTSHSPYIWNFCTIQEITSSLYDTQPPFIWHQTHYIWLHIHCICVITSTVIMISQKLYLRDLIRYTSQHHLHCIRHDSHWICVITPILSMISHPLYGWHHTHYMYKIIYTT